jgi:hypothetical protein
MAERYRFLSVVLDDRAPPNAPYALVLECEDGQWWMYYLAPDQKIQTALPFPDLEAAQNHALAELSVKPNEWIDDGDQ